jgi:hypothetical protein
MSLMRHLRRPLVRTATVTLLCLVMAALFGAVLSRYWSATATDIAFVKAERRGVAYLKPLSRLVGELTEAQAAAVRGAPVDVDAVRAGVREVDAVDRTEGAALQTHQRWSELRARIDAVLTGAGRGPTAYGAYTETAALALDLVRKIGDTSNLILDPQLDSFYLMDTALINVPDLLLHAGRATDLVTLAGDRTPGGEDAVRLAVARHRVATNAEAVVTGLRKAIDATDSSTLGPNLTTQLDQFQGAVDRFVPPTVIAQLATRVDTRGMPADAQGVRDSALALAATVLTELDALLRQRQDRLADQQVYTAGAAAVVLLAGILLLVALVAVRRPVIDAEPVLDPTQRSTDESEPAATNLVDARDLLIEELIHVGRAVRPRARKRVDDDAL